MAGRQSKSLRQSHAVRDHDAAEPDPRCVHRQHRASPRQEYKLTANLTPEALDRRFVSEQQRQGRQELPGRAASISARSTPHGVENPNNFKTLHYNGVITNNFLIEGDWAKKYFAFVGFGGSTPPHQIPTAAYLAEGTPVRDQRRHRRDRATLRTSAEAAALSFATTRSGKSRAVTSSAPSRSAPTTWWSATTTGPNSASRTTTSPPTDFRYDVRGDDTACSSAGRHDPDCAHGSNARSFHLVPDRVRVARLEPEDHVDVLQ